MPIKTASNKQRVNVLVSDSAWSMYLSSKEAKEWYYKHEYEMEGEKRFRYRRKVSSVQWKIFHIWFDTYGNTQIRMTDGKENISISITNHAKWLSRATKAFLTVWANIDFDRWIDLSFYTKKSVKTFDDWSEKEYENIRCSVSYRSEELEKREEERPAMIDIKKIPKLEVKESKGKKTFDASAQDEFFEGVYEEMRNRMPEKQAPAWDWNDDDEEEATLEEKEDVTSEKKEPNKKEVSKKKDESEDDDDDLPF